MKTTVRTEGFAELDKTLAEMPKATAKNIMRRTLRKVGQPMADTMKAKAPVDDGHLRDSIGVGTRLTRRQAGLHRKMFKDDKASVEVFVGAGGLPQAITQEFGTFKEPPQSFARPAWDQHKGELISAIGKEMWAEIEKAAKRQARKAARLAKG